MQGSNYDVVEELYDNMHSFDKRMKNMRASAGFNSGRLSSF